MQNLKTKKKSNLKVCSTKVKNLDAFGEPFMFLLPEGQKTKQSWSGLITTVICVTVVIFYGLMQLFKLLEFGEPTIMVSVRDSYYDTDF